jgi:hypothetical protein
MDRINGQGELPGAGPEWACDSYGLPDHDYCSCPDCLALYELYMAAKASISVAA